MWRNGYLVTIRPSLFKYIHKCMCVYRDLFIKHLKRCYETLRYITLSLLLWWKLTFWVLPGFSLFFHLSYLFACFFSYWSMIGFHLSRGTLEMTFWKCKWMMLTISEYDLPVVLPYYHFSRFDIHKCDSRGATVFQNLLGSCFFGCKYPICSLLWTCTLVVFSHFMLCQQLKM